MSDSETKGRCRSEMEKACGTSSSIARVDLVLADAIDRLAADVEAIKEAVCDGSVAAERDRFLAGMGSAIKERDAAIRERDEARAEVVTAMEQRGIAVMQRDAAITRRDDAEAEVERLKESRDVANRLFGAEQAKVERLQEELDDREQEILSLRADTVERCEPIAAPQPAGQGISPGLLETQSAGNAAPAATWLTAEERRAAEYFAQFCADHLVPDEWTVNAGVLRSLLARAGSPPVVEVPAMVFSSGSYEMQKRYRAAMDKAGVKWKEVGRE